MATNGRRCLTWQKMSQKGCISWYVLSKSTSLSDQELKWAKGSLKASSVTPQKRGWEWQIGQISISFFLKSMGLHNLAEEGHQYERVVPAAFPLEAELVPS